MKVPHPGKNSLALLAALLLVLQVGLVPALARTVSEAGSPAGETTEPLHVIHGSTGDFKPADNTGTVYYILDVANAEAEAYSITCGTKTNLKNVIYLLVRPDMGESFSPALITGFRPGIDKIVIVGDTASTAWQDSVLQYGGKSIANMISPATGTLVSEGPKNLAGGYITQAKSGTTYTLTATPIQVGAGTLSYQWYKGASLLEGKTGTTLTLQDARAENSGSYSCEILKSGQQAGEGIKTHALQVTVPAACNLQATLQNDNLTANNLTITGDSGTLTASAAIPLPGYCDLTEHQNGTHGYQVAWTFQKEGGGVLHTATSTDLKIENDQIKASTQVTLSQETFGPSGKVNITATLSKDGTSKGTAQKEATVTFEAPPTEICEKVITGGTFTGSEAVDLTTAGPHAYSYTFAPVYQGVCNVPAHQAAGHNHDKSITQFALTTDDQGTTPVTFVTLGMGTNQVTLTFDKIPQPQTKLYLFAKGADGNILSGTRKEITVTGCNQQYTALAFTPATQDIKITGEDQVIQLPKPTGTLTGVCKVTGHNHEVFQYSHNAPAALVKSFNAQTGQLVLHRGQVPYTTNPASGTSITITATPQGKTTPVATLALRVYQDPTCNKVLTGVTGSQSVDMGRSNVATQQYTAAFTGNCNDPAHAGTHAVTWQVKSTSGGTAPGGVTVDGNGKVTFSRAGLAQQTTKFVVVATSNSIAKELEVTVTKIVSPASDSSSDTRQQYDNEWEDLTYDIEDARSNERITQKMGRNTNMPFTVWDTIRGRNVNLTLSFAGGYTWTVNGSTVKKLPDGYIYIPLEVKEIRHEKIEALARDNDVVILDLQHSGSFYADMRLTYPVGSSYAGKTLYLYKYLENTGKLSYRTSAKVDADGMVTFPFTSASTYLVSAKALYGETAASGGGGTVGSGSSLPPQLPSSSSVPPAPPPESTPEPEPTPPPASSQPEVSQPTQQEPEPAQRDFPLVPVLMVAIAAVILAIILVARRGNKSYDI